MSRPYYDLLTKSTGEVFETMSFMEAVPGDPIESETILDNADVSATICLAGEISGTLSIYCSYDFATQCFDMISGGALECDEKQICDTAGELANMVAGTFKRHISSHVDLFDLSLPNVSIGKDTKLFFAGAKEDFPRLLVPFSIDEQTFFYVELLYHKR